MKDLRASVCILCVLFKDLLTLLVGWLQHFFHAQLLIVPTEEAMAVVRHLNGMISTFSSYVDACLLESRQGRQGFLPLSLATYTHSLVYPGHGSRSSNRCAFREDVLRA